MIFVYFVKACINNKFIISVKVSTVLLLFRNKAGDEESLAAFSRLEVNRVTPVLLPPGEDRTAPADTTARMHETSITERMRFILSLLPANVANLWKR